MFKCLYKCSSRLIRWQLEAQRETKRGGGGGEARWEKNIFLERWWNSEYPGNKTNTGTKVEIKVEEKQSISQNNIFPFSHVVCLPFVDNANNRDFFSNKYLVKYLYKGAVAKYYFAYFLWKGANLKLFQCMATDHAENSETKKDFSLDWNFSIKWCFVAEPKTGKFVL